MKQYAQGDISERISVAANPMYPAYVIKGDSGNCMIDAGINLMGPLYLKSLHAILHDVNELSHLLLTHSHYDHLGAMPYLKRRIPEVLVGGSPYITELLKKENVLIKMGYLSDLQRPLFTEIVGDEDVSIESVPMDLELKDGDEIDLGGLTCRVLEAPGHTRDSLAFYVPELEALFPGEAVGVSIGMEGAGIHPQFLSSYDQYVASLDRLAALKPKMIGIGHGFVFTGDDALEFLDDSIRITGEYRAMIEDCLDKVRGNVDRAVEYITRKEYDEKGTIYQERNAYVINLTAQVKEIARMRVKKS